MQNRRNHKKFLKFLRFPLIALLAAALALAGALPAGAAFNTLLRDIPGLTGLSEVFILTSLDDGSVIFSQNETRRTAPASLTKVVTAIAFLENCTDIKKTLAVKEYTIRMFDGTNSSNAGILPGEILSLEDLLYCLLLPSANEAAAILADYVCPNDIPAFVEKMNDLARRLGCEGTRFQNPHGLDEEGHYTTAADIAKFFAYALSADFRGNAVFEKIIGTRNYTVPATNLHASRPLVNTNKMMNPGIPDYYCKDVSGGKTGTTDLAGDCIAAKADRNGYHYFCVVMRGQMADIDNDKVDENTAFVDCKALLEWTFDHIRLRQVVTKGMMVTEVPVNLSRAADHVQLVAEKDLSALVPEGVGSGSIKIEAIPESLPESLDAPVAEGQLIGKARVLYAGQEFLQINLAAQDTINRSAVMVLLAAAQEAVKTPVFKAILAAAAAIVALWIGLRIAALRRKHADRQLTVLPEIGSRKK
ncbi:MAG: serine hydrolase [Oscillospiraceae bacterium]|jgi:D-alanyl-D-alanine carboxypeptidase (penicillin-binding protein 5/6)|nr:serine hydrolase [Oscillospiraceae bacterium]